METPTMSVNGEGSTVVVAVVGHLTVANRKELQQHVHDALGAGGRNVVVDLAASGYVDSAGLGTLVVLARRVRSQGGEFRLANVNEDVAVLLALTKLDTILNTVGAAQRIAAPGAA